jgi:class 3 adenylate cyclase
MAAVLAADVVGYSRLMGKNGSDACDPQTSIACLITI